jgi:hypothetical protein
MGGPRGPLIRFPTYYIQSHQILFTTEHTENTEMESCTKSGRFQCQNNHQIFVPFVIIVVYFIWSFYRDEQSEQPVR